MDLSDIANVVTILNRHQIRYWFIGGRAIDLLLGYESRPHKDLDFFVHIDDFATGRQALIDTGFSILPNTDREEGIFLQKGELLVDLTKIAIEENEAVKTFGVYAGVSWPNGLLQRHQCTCGDQTVKTLAPENHIAMKTAVANWYANGEMREEDLSDIHHLKEKGLIS